MNALTFQGHAPAVRASRALTRIDVHNAYTRTLAFARGKAVTIAAISAALSVAGVALASNPLTYSTALVALCFVRLATPNEKGGEI